jgi:DNA-directed RNA polymerase subunit F
MNLKLNTLLLTGIGLLLASCGSTSTPVLLYANTATSLITLDEGFDLEKEYEGMIGGGQLRFQHSHFMDVPRTEALQNDWVEVRELMDTIRQSQQLQNQQRILIKMEASVLKALATIIEENNLSLSEASGALLIEAQATLDETKTTIIGLRNDIKTLMAELRTLMRSVNRPMMWDENLVTEVTEVLTEILPLTESLAESIASVMPSLISIRNIFIDVIPEDLSPLTEEVLTALSLFETQLLALNLAQSEIQSVQKDTRILIKDIHGIVKTMRTEGVVLSNADKAAITVKRLAISDAVASLKTIVEENKDTLNELKDMLSIENLSFINASLLTLLNTNDTRLELLELIEGLYLEIMTILTA